MYYLFYLRSYTARKIFVSRVKKKRQTTTNFEFFFQSSSHKVGTQTHRTRNGEKEALFSFFLLCRVHSALLNRPRRRRRSQEPTERFDVCCLSRDTVFTLYSYTPSSSLFISSVYYYYELFIQQREREKETRVWRSVGRFSGVVENNNNIHTHIIISVYNASFLTFEERFRQPSNGVLLENLNKTFH